MQSPVSLGGTPLERHQDILICHSPKWQSILWLYLHCICIVLSLSLYCRVLEASIAENKASLKRTHTEVWSDSPDPHDRKRMDNCPMGLKNVGNTCWFSAVIQVDYTHGDPRKWITKSCSPYWVSPLPSLSQRLTWFVVFLWRHGGMWTDFKYVGRNTGYAITWCLVPVCNATPPRHPHTHTPPFFPP